ncbi:hypothetical protein [Desulfoferula mesophila]|uniref:Uncharacterized protein n=1 Tax=Desulfoferula mesophila TaxID=3058419 RepID=A0AAU9EL63_9BACT|nr:hypothetical protein FAK_09950 [Desulfoferula mesophilus]
MKRSLKIFTVAALGALLLAGASVALAGNLTGNWNGNWTCPDGEIKNGKLHGNLTQNGDKVSGTWTLVGTIKGNISGPLTGTAKGGMFIGDLKAGGKNVHFDGHYTDNKITGNYSSPIGNGGFTVTK